jgi:Protein of unknown function (DUF3237)
MSGSLRFEELPPALQSVQLKPLFVMRLTVKPMLVAGPTPNGLKRIGVVTGGEFMGERLSGRIMDGGSDWQVVRSDAVTLDVRLVLQTQDDAVILMTYRGIRHGAAAVLARVDRGDAVSPSDYYFRTQAQFETSAERYAWVNRVLAIGVGDRRADGPVYSVFEIL